MRRVNYSIFRRSACLEHARTYGPSTSLSCPGCGLALVRSRKPWALSRSEEVDEQLIDAFRLVVVHPVRRIGQALHALEVWHVVAFGLGEVGAEVGIALPPD